MQNDIETQKWHDGAKVQKWHDDAKAQRHKDDTKLAQLVQIGTNLRKRQRIQKTQRCIDNVGQQRMAQYGAIWRKLGFVDKLGFVAQIGKIG